MTSRRLPEDVHDRLIADLPPGAYLTGAVVAVSYVVPGETDDDERGPFLAWGCDGVAGRWTHLGMVETVANDCRNDLSGRESD
jgi:hypothetical protein